MNLTPEIIADLLFAISQLRYFEKECRIDPSLEAKDIVIRCQLKVDDILEKMGMQDFLTHDQIIQILKLNSQNEIAA